MFFQGQTLFLTYLEMVGPIDVKRKGGALVGYWVSYGTLTFNFTPDMTFDFSRSNVKIAVSQELLSD